MSNAIFPRQGSAPDPNLSPSEQVLQLISNPFQASLQVNAFWASLATSFGISAGLALLFCFIRPRHALVYAPRLKNADKQHAPPPLDKGLFSWIKPVNKASEDFLVDKIGLDAVLFLRFTRMLRNIFLVLALIGILIMIPVNVTQGSVSGSVSAFAVMTPLYIWGRGLWAQVVFAWLIDLIIIYFLWYNYRKVLRLKRNYFESPDYQRSLHSRTLLVRDISKQDRTNEGVARVLNEVNPTGITPKTTVGRNVKVLPDLIEEYEETVRSLESILAKYMKNPDRLPAKRPMIKPSSKYKGPTTGGKVDAIDYLTERIRSMESEINDIRERVDNRDPMPYGFASWDRISEAHRVAFATRKTRPNNVKIRLAPRPNDLIWDNLTLSRSSRKSKRFMNAIWIVLLTIIWTPINAGIAVFLSNLSNLGLVWPSFQRQLEAHRTWWSVVQGIAAPALTSIVYLVLPIIFRRLQIRAGDVTKTARERHVLRNLYSFFTLNNLIVFSIFSAVWQYVTLVIQFNEQGNDTWTSLRRGNFFLVITTALCQISPFWVIWLLQRNLGAAIDLAQLWQLTYVWFARTFMSPTPRQNIEWTAPPAFNYASYYNYFLFYTTIALCYSTLQPIILVITAAYFVMDAFMKKYLLMYVFITKTESGGQFWKTLFNRIIFAVMLSNVIIAIVVKARGSWTLVAAIAPLLFVMVGFKWYCMKTFDMDLKYHSRTGMMDTERLADGKPHKAEKISSKFGHPALYKPLITPMVHAKAQHVLAEVYRGRLDSTGGQPMAFSDIAMQPMAQTGAPDQDMPFEIVPEAQQDFSYYRGRSDFKEEAGEIFSDSRSTTPVSFMAGGKEDFSYPGTAASSRASSPVSRPQQPRPVQRKEFDQSRVPAQFRLSQLEPPSDQYSDRANLLNDIGDIRTPNGEFMSTDRWQAPGSAYRDTSRTNTPDESNNGYDYFRGRR
ncbi:hypothetical protein B0A52_04442 [Exophiala mesophila]|uniref:CSC1/OSCA1-like 7TM region domain-containing protein n=1 Tax=Exophiala mesophila TaxID=212818 RepID=A0A438N9H4_EXOME|nr:hypothetical protein B0A52_04442 [Exophiala mesophila]